MLYSPFDGALREEPAGVRIDVHKQTALQLELALQVQSCGEGGVEQVGDLSREDPQVP